MQKAANDNVGQAPDSATLAKPCPICGKPSRPETRPFCSKRCSDVDLHRWLGGLYSVPVTEEDDVPDVEESPST